MSKLAPANLAILKPTKDQLSRLKPIKVLDVMEGGSNNFHDEGLFSVPIFGQVGLKERDSTFSYIDIRLEIEHPYLYKTLVSLRKLYQDIMQGREYAVWDEEQKDLVRADIINGDTGYAFFTRYLPIIKFKGSDSEERRRKIMLVEKSIADGKMLTSKVLVIPAGLRDAEIDREGRVVQSEINDFYRTLLGISNSVVGSQDLNSRVFDNSRNSLQRAFNELFDYIFSLLEGKRGLIASRWAARYIVNGTRNVITAMASPVVKIGDPASITLRQTVVGLYQSMKGCLPLTIHHLLNGWLGHVFAEGTNARLVNRTSLKSELVKVDHDTLDEWYTETGLSKLIDHYGDVASRLKPIKINDYYIGLVYRGKDNTYRVFGDIDELPAELSRKDVYPLTMVELLYLDTFRRLNQAGIMVTRFPYSGIGSCYPSIARVMTTTRSEVRWQLDHDWKPMTDEDGSGKLRDPTTAYPTFKDQSHYDTMSPHFAYLKQMGADNIVR